MNISSAVERIQKLGDLIEKLIEQSNEMRERVIDLEENVDATSERVAAVEVRVQRQNALLESLAQEEGLDPGAVYEDAGLDRPPEELAAERLAEAESEDEEASDPDENGSDPDE